MAVILTARPGPDKGGLLTTRRNRTDDELVRLCIKDDQEAWSDLVDRYKNLIYSVPIKYGLTQAEAADIFQDVCLGLLTELKSIREPKALPRLLLLVTVRKCIRWKKRRERLVSFDPESSSWPSQEIPAEVQNILAQAERDQKMRDAISILPVRCKRLVHLLFFVAPPLPYQEVAKSLGSAIGSIGFIRQRCLSRLKKSVSELNVE